MKRLQMLMPSVLVIAISGLCLLSALTVGAQTNSQISGLANSPDCLPPSTRISANLDGVKAGEKVGFEITSEYFEKLQGEFIWEVSVGTILSGQRSNRIVVLTPADSILKEDGTRYPISTPGYSGSYFTFPPSVPLHVTAISVSNAGCADVSLKETVRIGQKSFSAVNKPANVSELNIENLVLKVGCKGIKQTSLVGISVLASDAENDVILYKYKISSGKIIGVGAKVEWDLSGVESGTYSVTAFVDDGCGMCGKSITKTVTIVECDRDY